MITLYPEDRVRVSVESSFLVPCSVFVTYCSKSNFRYFIYTFIYLAFPLFEGLTKKITCPCEKPEELYFGCDSKSKEILSSSTAFILYEGQTEEFE